jgi:hypothetical protein
VNVFTMLPAKVRRAVYITYGLATLGVSSAAAYCAATSVDVPAVIVGIGGALVPIGALVSGTAASNVQPDDA